MKLLFHYISIFILFMLFFGLVFSSCTGAKPVGPSIIEFTIPAGVKHPKRGFYDKDSTYYSVEKRWLTFQRNNSDTVWIYKRMPENKIQLVTFQVK